jgi:hypothetical protein
MDGKRARAGPRPQPVADELAAEQERTAGTAFLCQPLALGDGWAVVVLEDYVFQGVGADGAPTDVKLSELSSRAVTRSSSTASCFRGIQVTSGRGYSTRMPDRRADEPRQRAVSFRRVAERA